MRIFVRFSLVLLALSLAACAPDLAKLQTAEFQPYEPDLSGIAEPATIRGSYVENTDILGKTSRAVGVWLAAITSLTSRLIQANAPTWLPQAPPLLR